MCFSSVYSVYLLYKLKKCRKHLPAYRALLWTKFSIWIDASWTKLIYIINFQFVLLPITIINLTKYWCIHVRSFVCKNAPFMWLMFSTFSLVFSNTHHVLSECNAQCRLASLFCHLLFLPIQVWMVIITILQCSQDLLVTIVSTVCY